MKLFVLPVFLFILSINLHCIDFTDACSCLPTNLQNLFCKSSFAAIVYVIKDEINGSNIIDDRVYTANVIQVFKPIPYNYRSVRLVTAQDSAMCGEDLAVNRTYLTTGELMGDGRVHIYLCGFTRELSSITPKQLEGLGGKFDCYCIVTDERTSRESSLGHDSDKLKNLKELRAKMNHRNCYSQEYRIHYRCESLHSFCRRKDDSNQSTGQNARDTSYQSTRPISSCEWDRNPEYLRCLENRVKGG